MSSEGSLRRDSNMELLRVVAMLFVMFLHTHVISFSHTDMVSGGDVMRMLWHNAVFVCVDVFVLLSGWYGLRATTRKLCALVFQVLFFLLLSYAGHLLFNPSVNFSTRFLAHLFMLNGYWFVTSYLFLFVLSPVLNMFVEKASRQQFLWVLVTLFTLQTIYGYLLEEKWYQAGANPVFFVSLYLLARYIRLYRPRFSRFSKWADLTIYLSLVSLNAAVVLVLQCFGLSHLNGYVFVYVSPMVITAALYLLLFFSKLSLRSKAVNWLGASSFSAYLLHAAPNSFDVFQLTLYRFSDCLDGLAFTAFYFLYVAVIFLIAVLIDQVRIRLWSLVFNGTQRHRDTKFN